MALIVINLAIFGVGLLLGSSQEIIARYGMWPLGIALEGQWWRLITSAFLHGGLLHVGFNMYVLYAIGPVIERALGSGRFLVLYLTSALGGAVASYMFSPVNTVSVGASGAIFGLMAALLVLGNRFRNDVSQVAILLAINFAIGFFVPGIDWRAHLGGALTGAAVAAVLAYAPRQSRTLWQSLGVLAILLVLVLATFLRTAQLQGAVLGLLGAG
jgi:membrane associated rhomboid family serine protease